MEKIKPWFKMALKDEAIRKMTREQYYMAHRWLRYAARLVAMEMRDSHDSN